MGVRRTRATLQTGYKWLDTLKRAHDGDEHLRAVLQRWDRQLAYKNKQRLWRLQEEYALSDIEESQRKRPWLTGGFIRPSYFNKPLPRLKPQPVNISGMLRFRRAARERRHLLMEEMDELRRDIHREQELELGALELNPGAQMDPIYSGNASKQWEQPITLTQHNIRQTFRLDEKRASTSVSPELMAQIKRARGAKHANKARERRRERAGEVLNRTLRRRASKPPPPMWDKMSEERRHMDRVSRSVSEVGYVAKVKRQLGFKLKNPDAWKVEDSPEAKERLDSEYVAILRENARRRRASEREETER